MDDRQWSIIYRPFSYIGEYAFPDLEVIDELCVAYLSVLKMLLRAMARN